MTDQDELARDEDALEADQEPYKKKLKRELRREALLRMEEAARSVRDFEAVTKMWDLLESNEVRRVGNHEVGRGDIPLEWDAAKDGFYFPRHPDGAARQAQMGDFFELIFSCPYEMHELIEDADVSAAVRDLKEDHKEILYYLTVRLYPCEKIAEIRGQSDRNIRKVRATLLKKLRETLHKALTEREKLGLPMTTTQRAFLQNSETRKSIFLHKFPDYNLRKYIMPQFSCHNSISSTKIMSKRMLGRQAKFPNSRN